MVEPDVAQALRTGPFAVALDVAVEASGLTLERISAKLAERGITLSRPTLSYWRSGRYAGRPVSLALRASGGTTRYRYSATGLPGGLSLNGSTGVISGTPTTWQNANVTATVTDAGGRTARVSFYGFVFP
jgi:hypothetical protein